MLRSWLIGVVLVSGVTVAHAQQRPTIGLALAGGSARGMAHVGVLRWLEEHRVPIDAVAGTSIGGLIGGAYAAGMPPDEIEALLNGIDWNAMFGSSGFQFDNVRRKRDRRAYASRLEFGLKKGIVAQPSLNSGQQVDLLLSRIAAGYHETASFDDLPTPFRSVAVDIRKAEVVVMRDGSLARALRATMSMPMVFPPVVRGEQILVDGGTLNNVPVDVARGMGAATVIAVTMGELANKQELDYSLIGLVAETMDAMIRANMIKAVAAADVTINVPLDGYEPLDWRRAPELIREGYQAAEAAKDRLLPLALDEASWARWRDARRAARKITLPSPAFVRIEGAGSSDTLRMERRLAMHVGRPLDLAALEASVRELGGLDRYETLTWELMPDAGSYGLVITAHPKPHGPPFLFLGIGLENITANEFRFGLGGRYLAFDVFGSGAELRIDAAVGSDPGIATSWYRPLRGSALFIEPVAAFSSRTLNVIRDRRIEAAYRRTRAAVGGDLGVNLGRLTEARLGARYGWTDASVRTGDPGLPEIDGEDATVHARLTFDGQDDPVLPSRGTHLEAGLTHVVGAPDAPAEFPTDRESEGVTQAEASLHWIRSSSNGKRERVFLGGGGGTSFSGNPLPTEQFSLGGPLRMSAFSIGEARGNHYAYAVGGYLHQLARLPDFLGGPMFVAGWVETGAAFDRWAVADFVTQVSVGAVADTLIGPVFAGASMGFDGNSRFYLGIGRIFR